MILKIGRFIVLFVILFLGFVASRPSEYAISREVVIAAAPDKIFPYLNDSKLAFTWMPWADSDPAMKVSYFGPEAGVGAGTAWTSTGRMGQGQAAISESVPNQGIKTNLTYIEPMAMEQKAEITLVPVDGGTRVSWGVAGNHSFIGRLFFVFADMDKMAGNEFAKGLNKLKLIVERGDIPRGNSDEKGI